jgi:hypothetical protein
MRFDALGPELRRRRVFFVRFPGRGYERFAPVAAGLIIFIASLVTKNVVHNHLTSQLETVRKEVSDLTVQASEASEQRAVYANRLAIAQGFGDVRDSGFVAAKQVVSIGRAWGNPARDGGASINCLTASDDGPGYTITGDSAKFAGYESANSALSRGGYTVVSRSQTPKDGTHQEFTLDIVGAGE